MNVNGDPSSLVGAHLQPMNKGSGSLYVIRICLYSWFSTVWEIRVRAKGNDVRYSTDLGTDLDEFIEIGQ